MILDTDENAAEEVRVISLTGEPLATLWKSLDGCLYDDENSARYRSCTHRSCKVCGKPASKNYTDCDACKEKKRIGKYEALPVIEWDGKTPLYSESLDEFFFGQEDIDDYRYDNQEYGELHFVLCEPVFLRKVSEDYWCDNLTEDGELPGDVMKALENLNLVIKMQRPVSWMPGNKFRVAV